MEIEASPSAPVVAKKLWNIVRIVMIMLRKGIAKSKAISDLNLLLKRGKLALTNTLTLTLHHHRHHFSASSSSSFLTPPREYEFSCSSSPAINHHRRCSKRCKYDDVLTASAVQRVLEMLNNNNNSGSDVVVEGGNNGSFSPFVAKSPYGGKKLRITDSPFPLKQEEGDNGHEVDAAAEEFIKRFYRNLHSQHHNNLDAMDSPYNYNYHNYSWVR